MYSKVVCYDLRFSSISSCSYDCFCLLTQNQHLECQPSNLLLLLLQYCHICFAKACILNLCCFSSPNPLNFRLSKGQQGQLRETVFLKGGSQTSSPESACCLPLQLPALRSFWVRFFSRGKRNTVKCTRGFGDRIRGCHTYSASASFNLLRCVT